MPNLMFSARQRGVVADVRGASVQDSSPFYDTYACTDAEHITVGALEPQFHTLLLSTLGLADDADFTGAQWLLGAWPRRRARLAVLFLTQPRTHWQTLLEPTDACFGAVLSPVEAGQHQHLRARGVYSERHGVLQAASAPRFDGAAHVPGEPGAHTQAVMEELAKTGANAVWRPRSAL